MLGIKREFLLLFSILTFLVLSSCTLPGSRHPRISYYSSLLNKFKNISSLASNDDTFSDLKKIFSGMDQEAKAKNSSLVEEIMKKLSEKTKSKNKEKTKFYENDGSYLRCAECEFVFTTLKSELLINQTFENLLSIGNAACSLFINSTVCSGIMQEYGVVFLFNFILKYTEPSFACGSLGLCPNNRQYLNFTQYLEEVLSDKPSLPDPQPTGRQTYKLLHLSDLHTDYEYSEGYDADCSEYYCCRAEDGVNPDPEKNAKYWGTLAKCDIPKATLVGAFEFIKNEINPDFIIWTGDNTAHDIWHQNASFQTIPTKYATEFLRQYFPDTPLFPIFGNHECFPGDQFDFFGNSSSWVLSDVASYWTFLDSEALNTLKTLGYYSTFIKERNLRIIMLNTQACDSLNFYIFQNPTDPSQELQWLRDTLTQAEKNNETVFIAGHIPPGDYFCSSTWAKRYKVLIDRFSHIIRGQFFGHTHNDQFETVYSYVTGLPVGSILIAPSLTTYSYLNPSIRVIEVDTDTNLPVNIHQYRLNLTKANLNHSTLIPFEKAYDFLSEYNRSNMSWASISELGKELQTDEELLKKYIRNFFADGPDAQNLTITEYDKRNYGCMAENPVFNEKVKCLGLDVLKEPLDLVFVFLEMLSGQWYETIDQVKQVLYR